ncbi:hypothetical protein ACQRBV_03120 [Pseudomonas sp. R11F]|uniref:hypothetical protein n=1 Tax=Pseudomonas TaxID=286 RepID=UPI00398EBDCA
MARQEINLGALPTGVGGDTPRSAMVKLNAMTEELYRGDALAKASGWGASAPISMKPTDSADALPAINGLFMFGNGGYSLPSSYVFIIQTVSGAGGGYVRQVAFDLLSEREWSRQFAQGTMAKPWQSGIYGDLDIASALVIRQRLKTFNPYTYVTNIDDVSTAQVPGYGYVTVNTAGTIPPGFTYGIVNTVLNPNDQVFQDFVGLTGAPGTTQNAYRRTGYGTGDTRWGPWRLVMDSSSALRPVNDSDNSGLMDLTIMNGNAAVWRYKNGKVVINIWTGTSVTLQPGDIISQLVALPIRVVDPRFAVCEVNFQPTISYDHYGVNTKWVNADGGSVGFTCRNGATAQQFTNFKIQVVGAWK